MQHGALMALGVILAGVVVLAAGLYALDSYARRHPQDLSLLPQRQVEINGKPLTLLIADTPATVGSGLSGQRRLASDHGLLLIGPSDDVRVTMLGMRFALDVVWLDSQNRVVDVRRGLPAHPLPLSYAPVQPAAAVIELTAGQADRYHVELGDVLAL